MALLFFDGFDHYVTADILERWSVNTNGTISSGNGRRSTNSLQFAGSNSYIYKLYTPVLSNTIYTGFAYKTALTAYATVLTAYDTAASRCNLALTINTNGSINIMARGTSGTFLNQTGMVALATSATGIITASAYNFIEMKFLLHDTLGEVEVRVNGVTVSGLNLTNQDTLSTGSTSWNLYTLHTSNNVATDIDDVYICDSSGSAPWNTFLGDIRVDALYPTGAGATTGWTPSTGSNWQNVDDTTSDDDTTYNSAASAGVTDTFTVTDAPVAGATIYGVNVHVTSRKIDSGACTVAPVIRHSGTDNVGTEYAPGTTYVMRTQLHSTNPGTGVQWTESDFNNAEFGYKRVV